MREQTEPLTIKEWNLLIDTYLISGQIDGELYERCDEAQNWYLNETKKAFNRIKNK